MTAKLLSHRYGKTRVRVTKVERDREPHRIQLLSVDVALEGAFEASYTAGDNRAVVATDSIRNTVYVRARETEFDAPETLAAALAGHFVERYEQVHAAEVEITAERWAAIESDGTEHADAFLRAGSELRVARVRCGDGDEPVRHAGLRGLQVLKSAGSAFSGFVSDRFRALADTEDRILATTIDALWRLDRPCDDWNGAAAAARSALLASFARHRSRSVQETLLVMAEALLEAVPEAGRVRLRLPNQHHLPVDLSPFSLANDLADDTAVFHATDEPFGDIEATVGRSGTAIDPAGGGSP